MYLYLYLSVCMYVCICIIYIYIYIYIYTHTHTHICIYANTYAYTHRRGRWSVAAKGAGRGGGVAGRGVGVRGAQWTRRSVRERAAGLPLEPDPLPGLLHVCLVYLSHIFFLSVRGWKVLWRPTHCRLQVSTMSALDVCLISSAAVTVCLRCLPYM